MYYAIDNEFIAKQRVGFLHAKVKVFARVTPENKALVVSRHREEIAHEMSSRSVAGRWLGECSERVGMVGDGANDLIAIKEADLGIGISSSDAVYSSSFAVQ